MRNIEIHYSKTNLISARKSHAKAIAFFRWSSRAAGIPEITRIPSECKRMQPHFCNELQYLIHFLTFFTFLFPFMLYLFVHFNFIHLFASSLYFLLFISYRTVINVNNQLLFIMVLKSTWFALHFFYLRKSYAFWSKLYHLQW